jgi:hypothetical protein
MTLVKKNQILMGIFAGISAGAFAASTTDDANTDQPAAKTQAMGQQVQPDAAPATDDAKTDQPAAKTQATDQQGQPDQVTSRDANKANSVAEDDPKLVKAVEEALVALNKQSPVVQQDSLRVWKNFSSTSKPVNYTYRFWGRQLILWLKEEKKLVFKSETDVGKVFKILYHKGLISANAVVVLMVDAWGHLVYLEGSPDWEKREENRLGGGEVAPDGVNAKKPDMPV